MPTSLPITRASSCGAQQRTAIDADDGAEDDDAEDDDEDAQDVSRIPRIDTMRSRRPDTSLGRPGPAKGSSTIVISP
jgi:hypothetical protein